VTTVFSEQGGRTLFTSTILFPSEEVRGFILKSGLETSAGAVYDKLAAFLKTVS
jgi:hypothetical protein